ncbi:MAG: hypothetical protein ABEL76_08575 [Bradymonadaceae bacterium]
MVWDLWKEGFDKWESATADYLEEVLESRAVLYPAGKLLEGASKTKAAVDEATRKWWGLWGLPTKADQERALHTINQLEGRLIDLEEEIRQLREEQDDQ